MISSNIYVSCLVMSYHLRVCCLIINFRVPVT